MNISSKYAPSFCLNPEMKSIEPKIRQKMAKSNKNGAKLGGIFLLEIISTVLSKFNILPGIAKINIAEINILPIKFVICSKFICSLSEVKNFF